MSPVIDKNQSIQCVHSTSKADESSTLIQNYLCGFWCLVLREELQNIPICSSRRQSRELKDLQNKKNQTYEMLGFTLLTLVGATLCSGQHASSSTMNCLIALLPSSRSSLSLSGSSLSSSLDREGLIIVPNTSWLNRLFNNLSASLILFITTLLVTSSNTHLEKEICLILPY